MPAAIAGSVISNIAGATRATAASKKVIALPEITGAVVSGRGGVDARTAPVSFA
jgi:hypothetical protein